MLKFLNYLQSNGNPTEEQIFDAHNGRSVEYQQTTGHSQVSVVSTPSERYILRETPSYRVTKNEHAIFDAHLQSGVPLLLVGPKGTGKTLAIANWASKKKLCFLQ